MKSQKKLQTAVNIEKKMGGSQELTDTQASATTAATRAFLKKSGGGNRTSPSIRITVCINKEPLCVFVVIVFLFSPSINKEMHKEANDDYLKLLHHGETCQRVMESMALWSYGITNGFCFCGFVGKK